MTNEGSLFNDFMISMGITMSGFCEIYEPEAYAEGTPSRTIRDELTCKKRMCVERFSPWRVSSYFLSLPPALLFFHISHRIFHWMLVPLCLARKRIRLKPLSVPHYFAVMNVAAFLGFSRYLCGSQSVRPGNVHIVRTGEYG